MPVQPQEKVVLVQQPAFAVWSAVFIGADMTSPVALYIPLWIKHLKIHVFQDSEIFGTYERACVADMFPLIGTRIAVAGKPASENWDMVSMCL